MDNANVGMTGSDYYFGKKKLPVGSFFYDTKTAKAILDSRRPEDDHSDTCSMCGKFCAVRSMNKALAGEYIDIL